MADAVPSSHIETIRFDARVFSLVAVKKAAYRYLDKFAVEILLEDPEIVCMVKCTRPLSPTRLTELLDDFRKEVLDQDLREQIKGETEPIRRLILAHAFSQSGLADHEQVPGA